MLLLNIHDAKYTLSAVLANIEEHNETLRICRNGKPVAELVKIPPLPSQHNDPADRMIVATAAFHKMPVLTPDKEIRKYKEVRVVW